MKPLIILFVCLITRALADHSAQHERCQKLQSIADSAGASCSVGHSCFSLDCTPNLPLASVTEFHIFIEPCKHPAAILINGTVAGHELSHEFSHSETVAIPGVPIFDPKLAVFIDNSDSQNLVFSIKLITATNNYTIVPETSFPLNNVTCENGHLVTSATTAMPPHTSALTPGPYSCEGTCVAIHKMTDRTQSLCTSTGDCLTINCASPQTAAQLISTSSSYRIEPCSSPPTVRATFDEQKYNVHFSRNITHNTTVPLTGFPFGNPQMQVTLVDVSDFAILFGVHLLFAGQTIQILPDQIIPIDKSGCPGYTGPSTNPYCTQQSTHPLITTPLSHSSTQLSHSSTQHSHSATSMHTGPATHSTTGSAVSPSLNNTAAVGSDAGKLAGIILGVILVNVVIVAVAVLVTVVVVWYAFKRKNSGVYSYSHFQAMEEED